MGRSKHEFLAGALTMYPVPLSRDNADETTSGPKGTYPLASGPHVSAAPENYERKSPYSYDQDLLGTAGPDSEYVRYVRSPHLMGYTYSAELITEVTDTQIVLGSKNDGAGSTLTDRAITDVAAGTNATGIIKGAFSDTDTVATGPSLIEQDATGAARDTPTTNQGFAIRAISSTSDVINGLGANAFGCPSAIYDLANDVHVAGGPHAQTNSWGNMIGAMTTFVLHDTSPAGSETDTVVRQFQAPFAMRILKVTFGCAGSGASNTVAINNKTQSTVVIADNALVAAGSIEVEPDDATFNAANRNVAYNDELELEVTTVGTGFTNVWCMVTCTVTGNAYGDTDNARTWSWRNGNATANPTQAIAEQFTHGPTRHASGPVIGAPIAMYIGGDDSSASAADEERQTLIAPFDMDVFHVAIFSHSSDVASTTKVRNITRGVDIVSHTAVSTDSPNTTDTQGNGTFAVINPTIKRGDTIGVYTTTSGTITTFAGAIILGIARGFPYDNAALD